MSENDGSGSYSALPAEARPAAATLPWRRLVIRAGCLAAGVAAGTAVYVATHQEVSSRDARDRRVAACAKHLGTEATLFTRHHLPGSCKPFEVRYADMDHPGTYRFPPEEAFRQEQITNYDPAPYTDEDTIYRGFLTVGGGVLGLVVAEMRLASSNEGSHEKQK